MNEKTLLALLTRLAHQLIELHDKEGDLERRSEFAARLAQATWDGLVFTLRQSIASKETVVLEDLGIFKYDGEKCAFVPAASLAEAGAMNLNAEEGHRLLARRALFYLDQGAALLNVIPQNIVLTTHQRGLLEGGVGEPAVENLFSALELLRDREQPSALSAGVRQRAAELSSVAKRLEEGFSGTAKVAGVLKGGSPETVETVEDSSGEPAGSVEVDFDAMRLRAVREAYKKAMERRQADASAQGDALEDFIK